MTDFPFLSFNSALLIMLILELYFHGISLQFGVRNDELHNPKGLLLKILFQ